MPAGEGKIANLFLQCRTAGPAQFKRKESRDLKVVTNEKGEAVGDVLTIIC
jgi:hypothetical protein